MAAATRSPSHPTDSTSLLHHVRVAARRRISDGFARITFTGPTLDAFADPGLDQRIKLILPGPTAPLRGLTATIDWYAQWRALPTAARPIMRTYTTRAVRPDAREVDVDLVLHEPCGPAGRFASAAREGDEAVLVGPNRWAVRYGGGIDFRPPSTATHVLIAGDETALPAIARILEALPAHLSGTALVEVPFAGDAAQLPTHPQVRVQILVRGGAPVGTLLPSAVRMAAETLPGRRAPARPPEDVDLDHQLLWEVPDPQDGVLYAWLAGEAATIKTIRRTLVADLGLDRRSVAFMGYWRAGRPES